MKPIRIHVLSRRDGTHVIIHHQNGKNTHRVYPEMGEALASIQSRENHHVPIRVNGQGTIINCWARG